MKNGAYAIIAALCTVDHYYKDGLVYHQTAFLAAVPQRMGE